MNRRESAATNRSGQTTLSPLALFAAMSGNLVSLLIAARTGDSVGEALRRRMIDR